MITDKQRQRDNEFDGEYQSKSHYTPEQWENILRSGQITEEALSLLKQVYRSYNHAATLLQLSFDNQSTEDSILTQVNAMGKLLGEANDISPDTDYDGNEYWWFLCFWGKNNDAGTLELKLQPELTEAVGALWPELEQSYYAFMNDVERSLQIRYSQEDAVWIASAVLLYEKYYRYPGISTDDILLMQYEVQVRAQKVFGQDVDVRTITQICNADERGHRFNYLRDIYKYYRVSFPGEFDGDRERPDPENLDYSAYVYSIFGYMSLEQVVDFIEHEYAHLVDESYVELNASNGFVRLTDFLTRQGGAPFDPEDTSEQALSLRADGEDCITTFHMLSEALLKEYPNFIYMRKADWYDSSEKRIAYIFCDVLAMENYAHTHACLSFLTIPDKDAVNIEIALNLPFCSSEEAMLEIQDKCGKLSLMTAAPFQVRTTETEGFDLTEDSQKIKASVLYSYEEFKTMSEENIIGLLSSGMEILASYYTDICQNYYPAAEESTAIDPLAAALGSRLTYRPASDTPELTIRYKQASPSPTSDRITRILQGYRDTADSSEANDADTLTGNDSALTDGEVLEKSSSGSSGDSSYATPGTNQMDSTSGIKQTQQKTNLYPTQHIGTDQSWQNNIPASMQQTVNRNSASQSRSAVDTLPNATAYTPGWMPQGIQEEKVPVSTHADRRDQSFRLYPKNTLIKGPLKTRKYHEAILTAVGIIEGKDLDMMRIEPVPEVLEHYQNYIEENRIMHVSYPDMDQDGFDGWIEDRHNLRDGIFKEFANRCGEGRYVVMMEEVDLNWMHLFGETSVLLRDNRREGSNNTTTITLLHSKEPFRLPSNLYIVATCDANICEDTILGAVSQDFFIRHISPDASVLREMKIEGISLEQLMTTLNLRISYFLGPDFQLGEGFFLGSPDKDPFISLARIFREQLIPLLEKWFDGDIERIRYVLGDNGKQEPDTIFYQETPFRQGLFKGKIPDSFDTEKYIYQINEKAFLLPQSYIQIYD